jgi:hypothetical protein
MLTSLRTIWAVALVLAAGADPIFRLLPGDGIPPGWQRRGEARLFPGAALYQHIDGGAELYHRNGFDRLAVQDYSMGDHEVRVEIYRMNEAAGAAAVFSEMTAGLAPQALYGTACLLDDYQVLFYRGPCCVSLTTYTSGAEPAAAMAALAAKIDAALAAPSR